MTEMRMTRMLEVEFIGYVEAPNEAEAIKEAIKHAICPTASHSH
jgi:hypothetical protein